jgi:hypothetical protein
MNIFYEISKIVYISIINKNILKENNYFLFELIWNLYASRKSNYYIY